MADTNSIRNMILTTPLLEQPVSITGWEKDATGNDAHLIIRELDGKEGSDLIAACSDSTGKVNQEALVAGIILASLRNADDPQKALVFSFDGQPNVYNPAYRDGLMATGLGRIMQVAQSSIKLSGLDQSAVSDAKNASSGTVVDGSATVLPQN